MVIVLKVFMILLAGVTLGTQVFAVQWHTSPSLGAPALLVGEMRFYAPWQGLQWCWWWCHASPRLFLWAGGAAGGIVVLLGSLWGYAVVQGWQTGDGLATPRQLRKAKVLRKEGIVVGKQP